MLAFTEILKSHISGIKIDINPIRTWRGGGGGKGLEAQITKFTAVIQKPLVPIMPKLCHF